MAKSGIEEVLSRNYHNINIPLPDVYSMGGPTAFTEFASTGDQKNAILLPTSFRAILKRKEREDRGGSKDALAHIAQRLDNSELTNLDGGKYSIASAGDIDIIFFHNGSDERITSAKATHDLVKDIGDSHLFNNPEKYRFVTNDNNMNIDLQLLKKSVEKPRFLTTDPSICRQGFVDGSQDLYAELNQIETHSLPLDQVEDMLNGTTLFPNQFLRFVGDDKIQRYAFVTGDFERKGNKSRQHNKRVELVGHDGFANPNGRYRHNERDFGTVMGTKSLDSEQYLAFTKALLDPNIEVIFLTGQAGCGKTVLGYSSMVGQIVDFTRNPGKQNVGDAIGKAKGEQSWNSLYKQGVILKSIKPVAGEEVGFLPGGLLEKLYDHLVPYEQAHELTCLNDMMDFQDVFFHSNRKNRFGEARKCEYFGKCEAHNFELPFSEMVKLTYSGFMRGTSYANTFMLVDESQNFEPYVMQMIMQRAAQGSKIVLMGDPYQIDNPDCTPDANGLTWAIKRYMDKDYSALINLGRSHRSQAAEVASTSKVY